MKKWTKYLIITGCVALFLFLMLPFLTTPTLGNDPAQSTGQTAKPQIFTSNPLTALVNRIAKLFGKQQTASDRQNKRETTNRKAPSEEFFSAHPATQMEEKEYLAAATATEENSGDTSGTQTPKNVYVVPVDNNVEWVLIQQHAPEDSPSGMHEVNVKDDAYTRYVKQERLARTAPITQNGALQEVPDSKLARLFRPITRLFGHKETPAAGGGIQVASAPSSHAGKSVSSDPLNRDTAKQVRSLPKAQDVHSAFGTPNKKTGSARDRNDKIKLNDLINPITAIQKAASLVASGQGNGSSGQPGQDVYQDQLQNYQQVWEERLQAHLLALSEGAKPVDQLGKTALCDVTKGLINTQESCEMHLDEDDIARLRETNRALFEERTGVPMPQTKLTPILGVASAKTLDQIIPDEFDDPSAADTKEIYRFMLENSNCADNACYWVANSNQPKKNLEQSVNASGVDFQGDPQHVYDRISAAFVESKLASLPSDATDEQKEQIRTQPQRATTPYVLYNQQDMDNLIQQIQSAPEDNTTTLYVASASDTLQFHQQYPHAPVLYGKQALSLTGDEQNTEDRAAVFTNDYIDCVTFEQGVVQDIQRDATQQSVENTIVPIIQNIQDELAKEKSTFDKNNSLGKTKK